MWEFKWNREIWFSECFASIEARDINIKQITTDRHVQIMREEYSNVSHQFDIWHVCKNICSKLSNLKQT